MVACEDFINVHKTLSHNICSTNVTQSRRLQRHDVRDYPFFMTVSLGPFTVSYLVSIQ